MPLRQCVSVGLVVACMAAAVAAQVITVRNAEPMAGPGQPEPATLPTGLGLIAGRVVEAGTTRGIAGAVVTLSGAALGRTVDRFTNGLDGGPRLATTDAQGQFLFYELPVGSYSLTSTATGFLNGRYGETRLIQIRRTLDMALERTVDLTEQAPRTQISIQMWQLAGIGGRVTDEHGDPMVGVPVTVIARVPDWGGAVMRQEATTTTDDRGMYHADVTPGSYIVGVLAATRTVPVGAVGEFLKAQQAGGAELQAFMSAITASGNVLPRGYGSRVGEFSVSQFGSLNQPVVPPMRDGDGRSWFYPSTFHPSALGTTLATPVTLSSAEERGGVDISMRPVPSLSVSGRLVGPEGPIGNMSLMLVADDPSVGRTSPATILDPPQALADGTGAFVFVGIAPGRYILRVVRFTNANEPLLWAAMPVAVGETDVADLEVRLTTGGRISGRLVIEGEPAPPPEQLRSLNVMARAVPGSVGSLIAAHTRAVRPVGIDPTRSFTTQEYAPGPYRLIVAGVPPGWILKNATVGGHEAVDRTFELTASGVTDAVVTITNRISTVTGLVRDEQGQLAVHASVAAFPVDRTLWRLAGMASRRAQARPPDPMGRYTFVGLPEGDYYVVAVDWPAADFSDADVLAELIGSAQRVTVREGTSSTQDLRLVVKR